MESICISICWYWCGSPFFFIIQNLLVFAYVYMCGSAKSLKETGEGQRLAPIPPGPPWIQNYPLGHSFDHFDPSPSLPIHHHHHLSIYIHFRPFTSIFIHHHPPSSNTIHFRPFTNLKNWVPVTDRFGFLWRIVWVPEADRSVPPSLLLQPPLDSTCRKSTFLLMVLKVPLSWKDN